MEEEIEDPLVERTRLREALVALSDAAPDLGVKPAVAAGWRSSAAMLSDPVLVMLAGESGSGKTLLASALGKAELHDLDDSGEGDQSDADGGAPLAMWKYGFQEIDVRDGDVVECYRGAPALRDCGFVEVAPVAFDNGGELAERAYLMADLLVLVFSADDPWGKKGWEFFRRIHKLRERPTAAVVTNSERRTAEELDAIVDYLRKTSRAAIAEEVPVFVVASAAELAAGTGVPELSAWIAESAADRPAAQSRLERGENVLIDAAETVAGALRDTVDDTDAEAECVRWMDAEIARERGAATAEAAAAMAPAREIYQDLCAADRHKLNRVLGPVGVLGSILRGGGWLRKSQTAVSGAVARRAEEGGRRAVASAGARLSELRRKVSERIAGVFGDDVAAALPEVPEFGNSDEVGRRAAARVREAAGDREAGATVAAMLNTRRLVLLLFVAIVGVQLFAGFYFMKNAESGVGLLCFGGAVMLGLWGAVILRGHRRTILARFDREASTARDTIGRDLGRVYGPEIEAAFDSYSSKLNALRERAGTLAADRSDLRARVLQAIEHAANLRSNSVL